MELKLDSMKKKKKTKQNNEVVGKLAEKPNGGRSKKKVSCYVSYFLLLCFYFEKLPYFY